MSAKTAGAGLERHLGHKIAVGLGLLMLVSLWYGLFTVEDEPIYQMEQGVGLVGGALAFGAALAFARGERRALSVGWAYVGTIVVTVGLHAAVLAVFGSGPTAATFGASLGSGAGYGFPYLLVAYGWKGTENEANETDQ